MIRISKQADYAIVLLTHFAGEPKASPWSATELAAATRLPLPTVRKILKILAREGVLVSNRGINGGYRLARRSQEISVAEIIRAMERPIALMECIDAPGDCPHEPLCPVRGNWRRINATVIRALQEISLFDMTRPLVDAVPAAGVPAKGLASPGLTIL